VPTSSVALAVNEVIRDKNKVFLAVGPATSDLTGKACSPNTAHWIYDTWALANGTGNAIVKRGGDTWFFLTADYAFGYALERDTEAVVLKSGGKVLGKVRHPFPGTDFSSFLLQAKASGAKIIGLANAGGDTINSIKQACRVRHLAGRPEARRPLDLHHRYPRARAQDRAGSHFHGPLVLGSERRQPRIRQGVFRGARTHAELYRWLGSIRPCSTICARSRRSAAMPTARR
jgi:hypothetical protein